MDVRRGFEIRSSHLDCQGRLGRDDCCRSSRRWHQSRHFPYMVLRTTNCDRPIMDPHFHLASDNEVHLGIAVPLRDELATSIKLNELPGLSYPVGEILVPQNQTLFL